VGQELASVRSGSAGLPRCPSRLQFRWAIMSSVNHHFHPKRLAATCDGPAAPRVRHVARDADRVANRARSRESPRPASAPQGGWSGSIAVPTFPKQLNARQRRVGPARSPSQPSVFLAQRGARQHASRPDKAWARRALTISLCDAFRGPPCPIGLAGQTQERCRACAVRTGRHPGRLRPASSNFVRLPVCAPAGAHTGRPQRPAPPNVRSSRTWSRHTRTLLDTSLKVSSSHSPY